jgi:hypothetical protein
MSHPNHQRRRNQTFRVEALESRALLSTAGVVSRPAAAVAPLARFAQFSNTAEDPKLTGTFAGTISHPEPHRYKFETVGTVVSSEPNSVAGQAFAGGESKMDVNVHGNKGHAILADPSGSSLLKVNFTVQHLNPETGKFTLKGDKIFSTGVFKGAKGTFEAHGDLNPQSSPIPGFCVIKITIHLR